MEGGKRPAIKEKRTTVCTHVTVHITFYNLTIIKFCYALNKIICDLRDRIARSKKVILHFIKLCKGVIVL